MDIREQHLNRLKLAEQQFRLACTVHLAVANGVQTLDVPIEWTFGPHRVSYEDFGLRADQADYAALHLEMAATHIVVCVVRDAIIALFPCPKAHADANVVASYQISRMIRNAFAHSMLYPRWSIDPDCFDRTFTIDKIITLNTTGLNAKPLEWQHYGGPLAIFHFGRFVRETLLGDKVDPARKKPPPPMIECYQQGRLIVHRIDNIPPDAIEVARGDTID
jgi:hypothetical protein